jgi:agmatinase
MILSNRVDTADIDIIGVDGVVDRIKEVVGDKLVYLSIDIDVLGKQLSAFSPLTI